MVPHSYQEHSVRAEAFGSDRAAGHGCTELFGCYRVPELFLHVPQAKASPGDGVLGVKQDLWQQPSRWVAGHSDRKDILLLLSKHKSKASSF